MTNHPTPWTATDNYLHHHLVKEPPHLAAATKKIRATTLPPMEVSPAQGKLLYLIAKIANARRILEIGTFYGYSTMWLAYAVPDNGLVLSIELTEKFVTMAQENINDAKLSHKVKLMQGDAAKILNELIFDNVEPFDMIFIDAHKPSYPEHLRLCMRLAKPGTIIVGDNVILDGELSNTNNANPKASSLRQFIEDVGANPALESTALQTVGAKGYDGFTFSVVTE